jgi:hypothetical protein
MKLADSIKDPDHRSHFRPLRRSGRQTRRQASLMAILVVFLDPSVVACLQDLGSTTRGRGSRTRSCWRRGLHSQAEAENFRRLDRLRRQSPPPELRPG